MLRLLVSRNIRVRFGQFMRGKQIGVPKGVYVYVGSAMGTRERLGQRLARHTTRGEGRRFQDIRDQVVGVFGNNVLPRRVKRLRWHIDFLVDRYEVTVSHVWCLCSAERLEGKIAEALLQDEQTGVLAVGLGASDAPGKTHILRVPEEMAWWRAWGNRFMEMGGQ